jgi:hypothetical protein
MLVQVRSGEFRLGQFNTGSSYFRVCEVNSG